MLNFHLCFLTYLQEPYKVDGIIPFLMEKLRFNERICGFLNLVLRG